MPNANVTQTAVEVLVAPLSPAARVQQTAVEVLVPTHGVVAEVTQTVVEVLVQTEMPCRLKLSGYGQLPAFTAACMANPEANPYVYCHLFVLNPPPNAGVSGPLYFTDAQYSFNAIVPPTGIFQAATTPYRFSAGQMLFKWPSCTVNTGGQDSSMDLTVIPMPDETGSGLQFLTNCWLGLYDYGVLVVYHCFIAPPFTPYNPTIIDTVEMYSGIVGQVEVDRSQAKFTLNSLLYAFNRNVPPNLFGSSCSHQLYDPGCSLLLANFKVAGAVSTIYDQENFLTTLTRADAYFSLGTLYWLTGNNAGAQSPIKLYQNNTITLQAPAPFAVASGDTFYAAPGCDKTQGTCNTKFNNLAHFRGFPYIPPPDMFQ